MPKKIPPTLSLNPDPEEELHPQLEDDTPEDTEENLLSLGTSRSPEQEREQQGGDGTINPPFP